MKSQIFAVVIMGLLAACSYKPNNAGSDAGSGAGAGSAATAQTSGSGAGGTGGTGGSASGSGAKVSDITPGSERDFIINVGDRVFFAYDSSEISNDAKAVLSKQAVWLKQYPAKTLTVEGHCDERGTREYNLALGAKRANSIKEVLVSLGVNPDRLTTISYGKEKPAVNGSDENAYSQNRRGVSVVK